jgi:hypothetical protein
MNFTIIGKRYMLQMLIKAAMGEGVDEDLIDTISERGKPLTDKQQARALVNIQRQIGMMRNRLAKRGIIKLEALPWEDEPPELEVKKRGAKKGKKVVAGKATKSGGNNSKGKGPAKAGSAKNKGRSAGKKKGEGAEVTTGGGNGE